ncbi:hypothetical protein BN946_scf184829.g78 [Trametes cinnabarina]|uniref:CCHC-type domain-containing protein n=1 Tax=Pycnoporus cinnabarinus TaxID=5643 RepID=A0A060SFE7_PYCCI|nr:hypothetical protein BN946_scf184829.g78 [Trametes cinnabarina]
MHPLPKTCNKLYTRAATLEQQWHLSRAYDGKAPAFRPTYKPYKPHTQEHDPNAMDIDKMTTEERERHKHEGRCFHCQQIRHLARQCPNKKNESCKKTTKARITKIEEEGSSDDEDDMKSTSTRGLGPPKQLTAACICLALKELDSKDDNKEILSSLTEKGF